MSSVRLNKAQIEKIGELELEHFEENIQRRNEQDAWSELWRGRVGSEIDWEAYNAGFIEREPIPYFAMGTCTRMVDQQTEITGSGLVTMRWFLEWDVEQIKYFREGFDWAVNEGLEVPDGVLEALK